MNTKAPAQLYENGEYLSKNPTWHIDDSPYKAGLVIEMIERNCLDFHTCADVGCGAGLVSELLAKHYPSKFFSGFEMASDAQEFIRSRESLKNLSYYDSNFFDFSGEFDLVVCLDVFEHVEDYFGFLRSLKRKGRKFIFNIPLDMNAMKILTQGIKYAREGSGHLHYFNRYSALESLKECGYVIKSSRLSAAFLKTPPRNIRQALVLPFRLGSVVFGKAFAACAFGGVSLVVYAE
jgi:hypothetical protein